MDGDWVDPGDADLGSGVAASSADVDEAMEVDATPDASASDLDGALNEAFGSEEAADTQAAADLDAALDEVFEAGSDESGTDTAQTPPDGTDGADKEPDATPPEPPSEPGGLDYTPSPTGVGYPSPEDREGGVGGPEKLG